MSNLENCEDGSLPVVNLGRSIDYLDAEQKHKLLSMSVQKLQFGGRLIVQGLDIDTFVKDYLFTNQLNTNVILNLKSVTPLSEIKDILLKHNLRIISVSINSSVYNIEAIK
jgi:hypothetical protein